MASNHTIAGNKRAFSNCTGGPKCPLGIPKHPKASNFKTSCFPMGCSLCRSEKLDLISTNDYADAGVHLEVRKDMIKRYGKFKGQELFENEE